MNNVTGVSSATSTQEPATTDASLSVSLLLVTPASKTLYLNESATFTASGGSAPYAYSVDSGLGTITSGGIYTAPNVAGITVLRISDSRANSAFAVISITTTLALSPTSKTLAAGALFTFGATGGMSPYTYKVAAGTGTITAAGAYTAPGTAGTDIIEVTDSAGNRAYGSALIAAPLSILPALTYAATGHSVTFAATGGIPPYIYTLVAGGGTVSPSGVFSAPSTPQTSLVRVTDSQNLTADATVNVYAGPQISPAAKKLAAGTSFTFSASGGTGPYAYSIIGSGGTINAGTGAYTAPAVPAQVTVRVTDANSYISDAQVDVFLPKSLALGYYHSCALIWDSPTSSTVKCWGRNTYGQLGTANLYVGDAPGEMGDSIAPINLGNFDTGVSVAAIVAGYENNCALLSNGRFKCWGYNSYGVLGQGSEGIYAHPPDSESQHRGAYTDQMGDNLWYSDLGTGVTVTKLVSSPSYNANSHSCAILGGADAGKVKCFGYNDYGSLGTENTTHYGAIPANTGDNMPFVNLGAGRTAIDIAVGGVHSCAALDNGRAKCWGYNGYGQLGLGDTTNRGDSTAAGHQMDDNLPGINLGTVNGNGTGGDLSVVQVAVGSNHSCAAFTNGKMKCWGYNGYGHLGTGDTVNRGDSGAVGHEMGDALPYVDLGAGRTVVQLVTGNSFTCAILDSGAGGSRVKCFGYNPYGQLGLGDSNDHGNSPASLGDALSTVDLGTINGDGTGGSLYAVKISAGVSHVCATLNNSKAKCWGYNYYGQLGLGHNASMGTSPLTMGDFLPYVELGTGKTALDIKAGGLDTCALLNDRTVKCWGGFDGPQYGNLGNEALSMGDAPGEMARLSTVDLGTSRYATSIKSDVYSTCAILDDGNMKCWGYNASYGNLGTGDTNNRGDRPGTGDMGDALPIALVGTGRTVKAVATAGSYTCVILDSGAAKSRVKCFGYNGYGNLGYEDTNNRTYGNQLGDYLDTVNLGDDAGNGTGNPYYATQIGSGTSAFTCALLNNQRVKCWGYNNYGQLGIGTTNSYMGHVSGTMGNNLPFVDLGTDGSNPLKVTQLSVGYYNTCALFDSGRFKCWGYNGYDTSLLGNCSASKAAIGDEAGDMGANLAYGDLGTINGDGTGGPLLATKISAGNSYACAITSGGQKNGQLKCWGYNSYGELGLGDTTNRGCAAAQIGDHLPFVNLGTGRTALDIFASSGSRTCAVLDDNSVKCWGWNADGRLGLGDTIFRGTTPLGIGDFLPALEGL
ncbi:MAG: hypothetical protein HYW49_11400 [Deltaproteobacteria bacterium]|nr:hypothetical protein [Deltaproteobacteria bacterium]